MIARRDLLKTLVGGGVALATYRKSALAQQPAPPWFGDGSRLTNLGMVLTTEQRIAGQKFLEHHVSVDTHCHPGRFFLTDLDEYSDTTRGYGPTFEDKVIQDLKAGRVSAGVFSGIADLKLAEMTSTGIHSLREFRQGEAFADYERQLRALKEFASKSGLGRGTNPNDLDLAQRSHNTAVIFGVEGGDFIEDRLDRIQSAFHEGVRVITIVHYHINQIGDIQTESPVHGGLTALGKSIVQEMNRVGITVDLAHAPMSVVKNVVEISARPVLLSHSNLVSSASSHPRLLSVEQASLVAQNKGLIGAWPSGFGQSTLSDYIDSIRRLIDAVGIEHVGIGTDMDANYKPVFKNYSDWSLIPAALLARGLRVDDVAAVMGGNFMRVFKANVAY